MGTSGVAPLANRLLGRLTGAEFRHLQPSLEEVPLHRNQVLRGPGDTVTHVYFPSDAVVSLLVDVGEGRRVEVAMEGSEGAVGLLAHLGGAHASHLSVVRHAGAAMRVDAKVLDACAHQHRGGLEPLLRRYLDALFTQVARSGLCHRFHTVDARLARWLLMTADRIGPGPLHATQDSIARALGVRRSSVTTAAGALYRGDVIRYHRGCITVLDRAALRAASCPCYAVIKHQYDRFLD